MKSCCRYGLWAIALFISIASLTASRGGYSYSVPPEPAVEPTRTAPRLPEPVLPESRESSPATNAATRVWEIEETWKTQYLEHLNATDPRDPATANEIQTTLAHLSTTTQSQFGLIYLFPQEEHLELLMVLPNGEPLHIIRPDVPLDVLDPVLADFRERISHPAQSGRSLDSAQQLYQWLIAPLESTLSAHDIDTLIFCVGSGLRSAPLAALHDGQQFLVERYSLSVIPAFSLTDSHLERRTQNQVLAMGASEFEELSDLPAVPVELTAIAQNLWQGDVFLNEAFTQRNLDRQIQSGQFTMVHLATHATFQPGEPHQSYIQLWQKDRIHLDELGKLGWRDRPIELLVLSACQTALGDYEAELGFAGLSFQAGVKSTLASLWQVPDLGTLALMREFYWQLSQPDLPTKAEALRRAQVALLSGKVRVDQAQVIGSDATPLPLPPSVTHLQSSTFQSPYHWAGFTLVGSPW
jgi:CHAT domain-containing protein